MKLSELLAEEKLSDYAARLVNSLNIKKLGSGAYAHVFQHPVYHNVVVKVFTDKDVTYKKYLSWCMRNQSNRYVPQIVEMVPIKSDTGDKYNIVFMEKMAPISGPSFRRWLTDDFGPEAASAEADGDMDDLFISMDKAMADIDDDPDLKKIWAHIKTYGRQRFDMHSGNVMLKGRQIVFTDPVGDTPGSDRVDDHKF